MTANWLCLTTLFLLLFFHVPFSAAALSTPPATPTTKQGGGENLKAHLRVKIANSIAKGERRAHERSADLRPVCRRCTRPDTLCVCRVLPNQKLPTRTQILILQHPNERRKKHVSTVPLLKLALENVEIVGGYTFDPESIPRFQEFLERGGRKPLLLYPSENAASLDDIQDDRASSQPRDSSMDYLAQNSLHNDISRHDNLLILVDGTWNEAKRMVRDSPRLVECCQLVQFTSEASSIYDALRREPQDHCLSTLEACAQTLLLLEPETEKVQERLHTVLQAHVDAHLANARLLAPRHVGAAKHKRYDKIRRRREIERMLFEPKKRDVKATEQSGMWKTTSSLRSNEKDAKSRKWHGFVWQRLPDGAMLRSLRAEDAPIVNSWWEHKSEKSLRQTQGHIQREEQCSSNGCLGMEVNGQLVASIVRYEGGALGMLYVEERFRRRGYAKALLEQATRLLELRGHERFAYIVDGNGASEVLFASVGWKMVNPAFQRQTGKRRYTQKWIHTK